MKRRVEWSEDALTDLIDQLVFIAANNRAAADRVADRIEATADALGDFATGHPGQVESTYEKSVRGLPYIIAYELSDADRTVSILRVIHTARDWPEGEWPE